LGRKKASRECDSCRLLVVLPKLFKVMRNNVNTSVNWNIFSSFLIFFFSVETGWKLQQLYDCCGPVVPHFTLHIWARADPGGLFLGGSALLYINTKILRLFKKYILKNYLPWIPIPMVPHSMFNRSTFKHTIDF